MLKLILRPFEFFFRLFCFCNAKLKSSEENQRKTLLDRWRKMVGRFLVGTVKQPVEIQRSAWETSEIWKRRTQYLMSDAVPATQQLQHPPEQHLSTRSTPTRELSCLDFHRCLLLRFHHRSFRLCQLTHHHSRLPSENITQTRVWTY